MARTTDTRAQVRAAADKLAAAGTTPTPTLVKGLLGKGSNTTIVDELRKWTQERAAPGSESGTEPGVATPAALERLGASEAAALVASASQAAKELEESLAHVSEAITQIATYPETLSKVHEAVARLVSAHESLQADHSAELEKAYKRYESVQRFMMNQVAQTREELVAERARHKEFSDSAQARESALTKQVTELRDQVQLLRGRLEERESSSAPLG